MSSPEIHRVEITRGKFEADMYPFGCDILVVASCYWMKGEYDIVNCRQRRVEFQRYFVLGITKLPDKLSAGKKVPYSAL